MTTKLLAVVVLAGCGLSNSHVELVASIADRGEDVRVRVSAQKGDDIQAVVSLDDASATLHMRGQAISLSAERGYLSAHVSASPPVATDETFTIEVTRDGTTTMVAVTAPPAIDLTAPFPVFVPRSQDLVVAWSTASDDPTLWYIDGFECVEGSSGGVDPAATQLVISASEFGMPQTSEPTCGTTFHMVRTREVSGANDGFETTSFLYKRYLDIPFASTP